MKTPLIDKLRSEINAKIKKLRYREFYGSMHYHAHEGYICDDHSIAISFPASGK